MRAGLLGLLLIAAPAVAAAHETWLLPATMTGEVAQDAEWCMTSGMAFPEPDVGPKPDRVAWFMARNGTSVGEAGIGAHCPGALRFQTRPTHDGVAVLAVSLKPRDIDLGAGQVAEYLAEVDPPASVRDAWAALGVWRETYIKNAKALICIGDCSLGREAMEPVLADLEFVPLDPGAHPTRFRLLAKGKPLVGQSVLMVLGGGRETRLRTDAAGELALPAGVMGRVMLSSVWLRAPAEPGARFLSDFASIVFEAAPK